MQDHVCIAFGPHINEAWREGVPFYNLTLYNLLLSGLPDLQGQQLCSFSVRGWLVGVQIKVRVCRLNSIDFWSAESPLVSVMNVCLAERHAVMMTCCCYSSASPLFFISSHEDGGRDTDSTGLDVFCTSPRLILGPDHVTLSPVTWPGPVTSRPVRPGHCHAPAPQSNGGEVLITPQEKLFSSLRLHVSSPLKVKPCPCFMMPTLFVF